MSIRDFTRARVEGDRAAGAGSTAIAQRLALPVGIAVAVFTFFVLQVLHRIVPGTGADFRAMLRGARDLSLGHNIYGPAIAFLSSGQLRGILKMPVTLYVYPPPLAVVFRPLQALPPSAALTLWDAVNVTIVAMLFVRIVRISGARTMRELVLAAAIYGFYPLNMGLGMGQIDTLLSLLALTSYLSYRRGHLGRAGLALGVMTLIKPTIGILLLFFLARRAWQIVLPFGLTLAAGAAVSLGAVGAQVLWEYRAVAFGWSEQFGVLPLNQSFHGMVLRLLSPGLDLPPTGNAKLLSTVLEFGVFVLCAVIVIRILRHGEPRLERDGLLQFYAAFGVLLIGTPFTENLHFTWMLPGFGLLLVAMAKEKRWTFWHPLLVSAYLCLALPFAEIICWSATATLSGRLESSLEAYCMIVLAILFCRFAFFRAQARQREKGELSAARMARESAA